MPEATDQNSDCIFCKIVAGELPSTKVFENDAVCAFEDIHPRAPVHVLVIPRRHFDKLHQSTADDVQMLGEVLHATGEVARIKDVSESGYRVVMNQGRDGRQDVFHLHAHVLGGKQLGVKMC